MSTRSMVDFHRKEPSPTDEPAARLYHHSDGYPSERLPNIAQAVQAAVASYSQGVGYEYRINEIGGYMTDVAAFYVLTHKSGAGNVEIDTLLHGDIEYLYQVWATPEGEVRVRILEPMDGFWDETSLAKMEVSAEGSLTELVQKADSL